MTQTSETNSMAISILKHLNGDPLGTTTTLVDLCTILEALVATEPKPLLGHLRRGRHRQGPGHRLQQAQEQGVLHLLAPFFFLRVVSRGELTRGIMHLAHESKPRSFGFERPATRIAIERCMRC